MSTTEPLDVEGLQLLREGGGRLRFDLQAPPGLTVPRQRTAREILTSASGTVIGRVGEGGPETDLVGSGWAGIVLMSERFLELLAQRRVSGWRAVPVEIENDPTLRAYWLLVITGSAGPIYGVAGARREGLPALGQYLDPAEWDGSDMFVAANWNGTLLTAQCANMLKKARLRNVRLEPAGLESTRTTPPTA